ncbi:hypothetical protein [Brevundimonas variabilis]|uniref:Uncharacterized protein n=1 Tax=Brevundimonas variabilis TaxID=74312 RepID=A0A7W9CGR9_9CAUL|nr:hypothetical protein [Brevundimonas variabilis]MBB5744887.1 hypothetical protein [Brevundimonas variabilis]
MDAASPAPDDAIVVSHVMPTPVRLLFGGIGAAGTLVLLIELGPAIWPPSLLSLFFGVILLGGLSVTLAFMAGSALGPDQTWEIRPGQLTITYSLFHQTSVRTWRLADLEDMDVVSSAYDSDTETWALACRLPPGRRVETGLASTPMLMTLLAFLRAPVSTWRGDRPADDRLVSPDFSRREAAEAALARLRSAPT